MTDYSKAWLKAQDEKKADSWASWIFAAFDNGGFQAQLRTTDGTNIAAGAPADDDDVKACHGFGSFVFQRLLSKS